MIKCIYYLDDLFNIIWPFRSMSCFSFALPHHVKQYQANKQIIHVKKFSSCVQFIVDRFVRAEVDESGQDVELKDSRHVLVEELAECV